MKPLSRRFYSRATIDLATELLGRMLVHESEEGFVSGRIVEVEAYLGARDPGSHAFGGRTSRNGTMFGPPGHLYVYFTYGMHYCSNVVAERDGAAGAVLLRAVEPGSGIELMMARRGTKDPGLLARGPARLSQAFGLDKRYDGSDLTEGPVWVGGRKTIKGAIGSSIRVGLRPGMDQPWRFFEEGPWVSRPPRAESRLT